LKNNDLLNYAVFSNQYQIGKGPKQEPQRFAVQAPAALEDYNTLRLQLCSIVLPFLGDEVRMAGTAKESRIHL
jgi:hypothetical protein